jgi:Flp pilus assembly protein TadB
VSLLATLVAAGASGMVATLIVPGAPSAVAGAPRAEHPRGAGEVPVLRLAASTAVAVVALFFLGGLPGAVGAALGASGCWWATGRLEPPAVRRRRERLAASVPQAVDLMAACLAAGLSPGAALDQVAAAVTPPLADELDALSARLRVGVDPVTVWRDLSRHPQLDGLGRTVSRAVESGSSVAEAMLRLAEDLRRDTRAQLETRARAVGVKAALPLGVCLLPAFVLVGVVPLVAGSVTVLVGP